MVRVDHIGQRLDPAAILELHIEPCLEIGRRDKLALAQIGQHVARLIVMRAQGQPVTLRARRGIQRQHEARAASVPRWWMLRMQKLR